VAVTFFLLPHQPRLIRRPSVANAMHRALEILEIIEMICGHLPQPSANPYLRLDEHDLPMARSLAALARTSKNFQNPALDALWRVQHTLLNLLKCMPSDLWNIPLNPVLQSKVVSTRDGASVLVPF
jgi:hypothetical protein